VFNDPSAVARVHGELAAALAERGFASLRDAVGYAHR
jgi:dihydroorotate dehydrogenase (NAD+) catalytic subunit